MYPATTKASTEKRSSVNYRQTARIAHYRAPFITKVVCTFIYSSVENKSEEDSSETVACELASTQAEPLRVTVHTPMSVTGFVRGFFGPDYLLV